MDKNNFVEFLKHIISQKETSLAIAKDESELKKFIGFLESEGFRQAIDTTELFKHSTAPSKAYFIVKDNLSKDIYDFIVQYPTGQVEIYDKQKLKSQIISPIYKDVAILFVITKDTLKKVQESGFSLLEQVGMAYQS